MKLTAKNINDNFWIVQQDGRKIGNITVLPNGVEFSLGSNVEKFAHLEDINKKYPVEFVTVSATQVEPTKDVLGYPTKTTAFNGEFDVQHQLPLYTDEPDSRSKMCAGYYIVNKNEKGWKKVWCPKFITLKRNPYYGPFKTAQEQQQCWDQIDDCTTSHSAV